MEVIKLIACGSSIGRIVDRSHRDKKQVFVI